MIRFPQFPPAPAPSGPVQTLPDCVEWLRLALADGLSLGGGLSLEALFDRVEGRA